MDKYIGRLLDNRYEILDIIGTGGMAVVYRARDHRLNRLVAIKILRDDYFQDEEFRRRFHAESQAVAMLSHPNIVSVYDVSTSNEADYIVMELIDGITLKQYMEKKGVLNWRETLHFSMQIGKALEHAHSRGIVHRDIKPHNVMVLKNGSVKVTDFGIARVMSSTNTLTKEALGSVHYISPEQAKGGRVDNRSDIYSLGVVMYEMMAGRPPYDGDTPVAVAFKHINGGAPMPSTLNPNIPGGLEQIIMKAMALEPDRRYVSATEMLYDLEEFRKNPAILFYHNMEEIPPRPRTAPGHEQGQQVRRTPPRNTAERVAGPRPDGGVRRPRPEGNSPRPDQSRSRVPAKKPEDYEPDAPARNKWVTIGVIAAAALVVILIFYFAISAMLNAFGAPATTLSVPDFKGEVFEDLDPDDYPDLILNAEYEYNDQYEAGRIIDQDPQPRATVQTGSTVTLIVSLGEQTENMPKLTEMDANNAKDLLDKLELRLTVKYEYEKHDEIEKGKITRTEPAEGTLLTDGMTVTLWVSEGPEVMPMLANMTLDDAKDKLSKFDLDLTIMVEYEEDEKIPKDRVIRTEPAEGEDLKKGSTVTIWVSEGSEVMPTLEGMSLNDAKNTLSQYKLSLTIVVEYEEHEEIPKDKVTRTKPEQGATLKEGMTVTIWVSEGPAKVEVPKVLEMESQKAVSALEDLKLKVTCKNVDSNAPKDQVVSQSVKAGTMVDPGTEIVLEVSNGPTEPPTEPIKKVTYNITNLPDDKTENYVLSIRLNGEPYLDDVIIEPGTTNIPVELEGRGTKYFDLFVDGEYFDSIRVDFG